MDSITTTTRAVMSLFGMHEGSQNEVAAARWTMWAEKSWKSRRTSELTGAPRWNTIVDKRTVRYAGAFRLVQAWFRFADLALLDHILDGPRGAVEASTRWRHSGHDPIRRSNTS